MDPISPTPSTPSTPSKDRHAIHWILVLLVFLSLGLSAFLLYQGRELNQQLTDFNETYKSPSLDSSCKVGGCSGQICQSSSDEPLSTTCEYLEKYSCYKKAICEKQSDGQCGWTQTEELKSCLLHKQ